MKERQVSLTDLLVEILLRWRAMMVWMAVGAILFGGLSFVRSYQTSKDQEAKVNAAIKQENENREQQSEEYEDLPEDSSMLEEWLTARMTSLQIQRVEYTLTNEAAYADKLTYQENSLLMHMDPNSVKRAEITFYVASNDMQKSHDIEKVYEDIARSGEAIAHMAKAIGCKAAEITEGISIKRMSTGRLDDTNTFCMRIDHYDESDCRTMAQALIDFVEGKHDELESAVGVHQIMAIDQSYAETLDTTILNYQKAYWDSLRTLEDTISKYKTSFTEEEWDYYDFQINGQLTGLSEVMLANETIGENTVSENDSTEESLKEIIERGVTVHPGVSMKYVVLGMVLMSLLYAFIAFVIYVLNPRLRASDQLQDIYGFPQIGMIPKENVRNRLFGFIDQRILMLRDFNKRKFTKERALELSAAALKIALEKESADIVYLIGCELKDSTLEACEVIQQLLGKEKIQVNILNNVLYDAQAMSDLKHVRTAVLVEGAGVTLYNEIAQELELLHRQKIKVLGGIVVETV